MWYGIVYKRKLAFSSVRPFLAKSKGHIRCRIYNGKTPVRCKITEGKVGHKFGEFASTRKRRPSRTNIGPGRKRPINVWIKILSGIIPFRGLTEIPRAVPQSVRRTTMWAAE